MKIKYVREEGDQTIIVRANDGRPLPKFSSHSDIKIRILDDVAFSEFELREDTMIDRGGFTIPIKGSELNAAFDTAKPSVPSADEKI